MLVKRLGLKPLGLPGGGKLSLHGLSAALTAAGQNASTGREYARELAELCSLGTPYGKAILALPLPLKEGGTCAWNVINPFALIWLLCQANKRFRLFVEQYVGASGGLVLYSDGVTPGSAVAGWSHGK